MSAGLTMACLALFTASYVQSIDSSSVQARLLPPHMRGQSVWKTIDPEDLDAGITAPANTNIIFFIPPDVRRVQKRILFGREGENVRYWGYCFPEDSEEADDRKRRGLPGLIFMSRAEQRFWEEKQNDLLLEGFSVFKNLTEPDLNQTRTIHTLIKSRKEDFVGGEACYLQTEKQLPMGTDRDEDGANAMLERIHDTGPENRDTDSDGLLDGIEIFGGTDPKRRDTDGDRLVDGLEDKNRNGRVDPGESDPRLYDSDRDGLCDGACVRSEGQRTGYLAPKGFVPNRTNIFLGEDLNLNGEVDENETSPILRDTDNDGILDDQEYFFCILPGGEDCT